MSRRHLTQKQHQFLEYLQTHVQGQKVWPTYREIVDHFEYRSPNSVTQNLQALAKKGFLRRDHNGYHLLDRPQEDGGIAVRGVIRGGQFDASTPSERLALTTLFPGLAALHAIRLDGDFDRTHGLDDANYVLLADEEVPPGDMAVVLHRGVLSLRRVEEDGALVDPENHLPPLQADEAEILGRYAGHAGSYGVVRHAAQVTPMAHSSESVTSTMLPS